MLHITNLTFDTPVNSVSLHIKLESPDSRPISINSGRLSFMFLHYYSTPLKSTYIHSPDLYLNEIAHSLSSLVMQSNSSQTTLSISPLGTYLTSSMVLLQRQLLEGTEEHQYCLVCHLLQEKSFLVQQTMKDYFFRQRQRRQYCRGACGQTNSSVYLTPSEYEG